MIKTLNATIAVVAMTGAWWSVDVASVAELHAQVVCPNRHSIDFLQVTHYAILILPVQWNSAQFFILVPRENLWDHPGVSKAQNEQRALHSNIEDDADDDKRDGCLESSDDVVE